MHGENLKLGSKQLHTIIKYKSKRTSLFIKQLLPQGYMFRIPRVIIRPSMEQIQDYLSSSCTLGSKALTIGGINIVKLHIDSNNIHTLNYY